MPATVPRRPPRRPRGPPPMSDDRSVILELRGVTKHFGGVRAVTDLDFDVYDHEVLGLIGPNGAGKSTAIDLISGFREPDSGVIKFDGEEIQGWRAHRVAARGLVRTFQTAREWARLTVMDNMLVAAPQEGRDKIWKSVFSRPSLRAAEERDRIRARDLLRRFDLYALRDEYAGNLSGGQKRLLEFARVAMLSPRMVLLDEPLAGVNPRLQVNILEAIKGLNDTGMAIILIEHNLPFIDSACDRVVVMAEGTDIASGLMADLRSSRAVIDAYLGEVATNV